VAELLFKRLEKEVTGLNALLLPKELGNALVVVLFLLVELSKEVRVLSEVEVLELLLLLPLPVLEYFFI
jgi:hypothetical protein